MIVERQTKKWGKVHLSFFFSEHAVWSLKDQAQGGELGLEIRGLELQVADNEILKYRNLKKQNQAHFLFGSLKIHRSPILKSTKDGFLDSKMAQYLVREAYC